MKQKRLTTWKTDGFTTTSPGLVMAFLVVMLLVSQPLATCGQGTLTFDWPGITNGIAYHATWPEAGLGLRVIPQPPLTHDGIQHIGVSFAGYPHNGTPYIAFQRREENPDFVMLAQSNGLAFGLISVDLADPVAPSLTPVDITFTGFKTDGSSVSQTFTVGGGGSALFQAFRFNTDFALGLTRVEIPSPAWAMDNLVWIPEPSVGSLLLVGLVTMMTRWLKHR